ncbi:MAG: hypothetical protein QNJ15_03965 [Erythrobacter sp.]|nr:hypothetical protein [Erythrobacter sp.]
MNKANIFMTASWAGLAGLSIAAISLLVAFPEPAFLSGMILAVLSCLAMLWARNADEFTLALWTAGSSVAFGTMLLSFLGLPAAEGVFDGATGAERKQDIPASVPPALAIVAFYIGLFAKRAFGDA